MFRKLVLGLVTFGFTFGIFAMPITIILDQNSSRSIQATIVPAVSMAQEWDAPAGEINCGPIDVLCGLTKFTTGIFMFVSQLVLVVTGLILDVSIDFSLSSQNYKQNVSGFIDVGWTIIRDITNILFIFGLLIAAFYLILQPSDKGTVAGIGNDPKRIVVMVIIMALLVNFSLFFTKIIVDAGNIFGRVFYDRIAVVNNNDAQQTTGGSSVQNQNSIVGSLTQSVTDKSIALGIINKANPQRLILGNQQLNGQLGAYSGWSLLIFHLFISFLVFIFNLGIIYVFCIMIFVFLGRTFGLWLNMILSPLAFVLYAVPIGFLKEFNFESWFKKTVELAFLAPIFMFFMYLAIVALSIPIGFNTDNLIGIILSVAINLIAALFIILQGKSIAIKMSGEMGTIISKVGGMASGLAVGAVTGGTAFLARQTLGRAGAAVANSESLRNMQANSKFGALGRYTAKGILGAGKAVDKSSLDIRNANVFGQTLDGSMQRLDKNFKAGDSNKRNVGYSAAKEEDAKKKKEQIEKEAAEVISAQDGKLQQDIERKKAKLQGIGPMSDDEKKAVEDVKAAEKEVADKEKIVPEKEKEVTKAQEALDASGPAKAIKDAQEALRDFNDETKEDFESFTKEIKEAQADANRHSNKADELDKKLKPQQAEFEKLDTQKTRTPAEDARHAALKTSIGTMTKDRDDAQTNKATAEKKADAVRNSAAYKDIRDTKAALTKGVTDAKDAAKADTGYTDLQKNIKDAKTAVRDAKKDVVTAKEGAKAAKGSDVYKGMEKDVKGAEETFNNTQAERLEAIAGREEKWVDTKTFGNSTFDKGVEGAGRAGRAYEGFAGSTKGVRQGAESVREKIKGYRKPEKK